MNTEIVKRIRNIRNIQFKPTQPVSVDKMKELVPIYLLPRKGRSHVLVKKEHKLMKAINAFKKIFKKKMQQKREMKAIVKIQALWRGFFCRSRRLPNFLQVVRDELISAQLELNHSTKDGRVNSTLDEDIIIKHLEDVFEKRVWKAPPRYWFDMKIYDYRYGWIPVNVKSTTMQTADNVGNLALLLYSLTNYSMDLTKIYQNGHVAPILTRHIRERILNKKGRDYYFLVVNKSKTEDVVANSLRGLRSLTPNNNNLPFQVKWSINRKLDYHTVEEMAVKVIQTIQNPKKTWTEKFLEEIRDILTE